MSSTNKTANLELSQFIGSDKPAWLTDYNADMSKIDTGVHNAQTTATGADGKADANATAIGTLANLTTDAKTSLVAAVNEVDSHADTAQGTANDAATTANGAASGVTALNNYLNVGATNKDLTSSDISISGVGSLSNTSNIHIVGNTDNSLVKIYGRIGVSSVSDGSTVSVTVSNTGLTPTDNISINGCGFIVHEAGNRVSAVDALNYTINTNGTITFTFTPYGGATSVSVKFIACIIFVKNFGDE